MACTAVGAGRLCAGTEWTAAGAPGVTVAVGTAVEGGAGACDRIGVRSVVIEQGRQNGKPYRFESVEEYVLERRAGQWLAIRAETTQR